MKSIMSDLTQEQIKEAKGKGFLRNRGTDCFSGRVVLAGGVYTAEQLERIAQCARQYGNGKIAFTSRLSAEIVGIAYENIDEAYKFIAQDDAICFGGTGAKIRPIPACKGTTCTFGKCDTQDIANKLHEHYYIGWRGVKLPQKFKIAVGGCGNSCIKPSLNDFGIEATKQQDETLFIIYLGGTWGKTTRAGTRLAQLVSQDKLFACLDTVLSWYQTNATEGERLGLAIDRLGIESIENALGM